MSDLDTEYQPLQHESMETDAVRSLLDQLLDDSRLNHRAQVTGGVLGLECGEILSRFFQAQRRLGKK